MMPCRVGLLDGRKEKICSHRCHNATQYYYDTKCCGEGVDITLSENFMEFVELSEKQGEIHK